MAHRRPRRTAGANCTHSSRLADRLDCGHKRFVLNGVLNMALSYSPGGSDGSRRGADTSAETQCAVEIMGNDHLKVIAQELLNQIKSNITVDWAHREGARSYMRMLVKRILRKHGYLPDLQDAAVKTVLRQAEVIPQKWVA